MLVSAACGTNKRQNAELVTLKAQVATLSQENAAQREEIEDLNQKMFILHDRIQTVKTQMARHPARPAVQTPPAPDLRVVKLVPARANKASAKSRTTSPVQPKLIEDYNPDVEEAAFVPNAPTPARKTAAASPAETTAVPTQLDDGEPSPDHLYQSSFEALRAKQYGDAILGFDKFVKRFPNHDLADNALYWLGECYYDQGEHLLAIQEFRRVPELYPTGNKVPDALLKIGFAYDALGDAGAAERTLHQLIEAYPQSEATKLARNRLAELKVSSKR